MRLLTEAHLHSTPAVEHVSQESVLAYSCQIINSQVIGEAVESKVEGHRCCWFKQN